jgi:hypothetical protein
VKVLDFALAKAAPEAPAAGYPSDSPTRTISATPTGVILGTAAYMSPEQARGAAVSRRFGSRRGRGWWPSKARSIQRRRRS